MGILGLPIELTRLIGSFSSINEQCLYSRYPDFISRFGIKMLDEMLLHAVTRGYLQLVRIILMDVRVDPSINDNQALIRAAHYKGHFEIVKLLLTDPRVVIVPGIFIQAVGNDCLETVVFLLTNKSVDPSRHDNDAVQTAAILDHLDMVRLLLNDPRVDPSAGQNTAIWHAVRNRNLKMIRLLLTDSRVGYCVAIQAIVANFIWKLSYYYRSTTQRIRTKLKMD